MYNIYKKNKINNHFFLYIRRQIGPTDETHLSPIEHDHGDQDEEEDEWE